MPGGQFGPSHFFGSLCMQMCCLVNDFALLERAYAARTRIYAKLVSKGPPNLWQGPHLRLNIYDLATPADACKFSKLSSAKMRRSNSLDYLIPMLQRQHTLAYPASSLSPCQSEEERV